MSASERSSPSPSLARLGFSRLARGERAGRARELSGSVRARAAAAFAAAPTPTGAAASRELRRARAGRRVPCAPIRTAAARLVRVLGASTGFADFYLRHPTSSDPLRRGSAAPDRRGARAPTCWPPSHGFAATAATRLRRPAGAVPAASGADRRRTTWSAGPVDAVDAVAARTGGSRRRGARGVALRRPDAVVAVPAASPRSGRPTRARDHRHGQGRRARAQLRERRRRDLRRGAGGRRSSQRPRPSTSPPRWRCRPCAASTAWRSSRRCGRWTRTSAPRARTARSCARWNPTCAYYDRWAKSWEFQALLKARPLAGDLELGEHYVAALAPSLDQRGAGELRRLGAADARARHRAHPDGRGGRPAETRPRRPARYRVHRPAAAARARPDRPASGSAARSRRWRAGGTRLHRQGGVRGVLARTTGSCGCSSTGCSCAPAAHPPDAPGPRRTAGAGQGQRPADRAGARARWQRTKLEVRGLHERLFYRPLLSAVAACRRAAWCSAASRRKPVSLRSDSAIRRVRCGTSPRSRRGCPGVRQSNATCCPSCSQWFAEGADPDHGLLAFRRLSEDLGRRTGSCGCSATLRAAHRLTQLLSGSRFVGDLLEGIPEAVAWLESNDQLRPRTTAPHQEIAAIVHRYADNSAAGSSALRAVRRREVLRLRSAIPLASSRSKNSGSR